MRIIFAGTPEPAVRALQKLLDSRHEVLAVITRPDARRGRGRTLHPSPVADLAQQRGLEVLKPKTLKAGTPDSIALAERLRELQPDAIAVVAYGNLIPKDFLELPTHGWINLHFSLLPALRGASPVQWSIYNGDQRTGATTFRIEEGLDTGPMLGTIEEDIRPTDTAADLLRRLAETGSDLLVDSLTGLENGTLSFVEQEGEATYAPKITAEDARINWRDDAARIDRHVRAFTPAPGCWTMWGEQRVKVGPVQPGIPEIHTAEDTDLAHLEPGQVLMTKKALWVAAGERTFVRLDEIQPPGKRMMKALDWARGLRGAEKDVIFQ